jgi:hypothetical protein
MEIGHKKHKGISSHKKYKSTNDEGVALVVPSFVLFVVFCGQLFSGISVALGSSAKPFVIWNRTEDRSV